MSIKDARSAEDVEKLLQTALKLLPYRTNPWSHFKSRAFDLLNHPAPAAFAPLLITASVLLATSTMLFITGMAVRWRKGTLWFFRVVRVGNEQFVLPHYVCSISARTTCAACSTAGLQSFLWIVWYRTVKHVEAKNHFLANSLPWLPGVLSVCLAVWSLTTTWVLHVRAYRHGPQPWYASARFVNSFGIVLPSLVLCTLLPYGIMASNNLQALRDCSAELLDVLESEARNWYPGASIDPSQLHLASVLAIKVARTESRFATTYELFFSILAGWCGFLGLAFVGIASLYLRDLKRSIRCMKGRTRTGVETFAKTYRWLVMVTIGLGTSMIALAINVSWIAATLRKILASGTTNAIAIIVPLFTVAVLGIPVSLVILHNAISTPSARSQSPSPTDNSANPSNSSLTPKQRLEQENLDQVYTTQFDLVAALPLDRFAFTGTDREALHDVERRSPGFVRAPSPPDAVPFDSLELQPTPTSHSRKTNKLDGIVVQRCEETVTVVALPKEGQVEAELGQWNRLDKDDADEDEKAW
ncbi:hypothetical protein JCM3766R1_006608 [Sporobolomyces carnicolor]